MKSAGYMFVVMLLGCAAAAQGTLPVDDFSFGFYVSDSGALPLRC